jgi:hypothetical protein
LHHHVAGLLIGSAGPDPLALRHHVHAAQYGVAFHDQIYIREEVEAHREMAKLRTKKREG